MFRKLRIDIRQNEIEKLFFGFLKLHNVYNEFLVNYREQGHWRTKSTRLENTLRNTPEEAINFAFCWADTPQDHNFWDDLSDEWHEFLDKFQTYYEKRKPNI